MNLGVAANRSTSTPKSGARVPNGNHSSKSGKNLMNRALVALALTTLAGCATNPQKKDEISPASTNRTVTKYKNNQSGLDSIITNKALTSFKGKYSVAAENKAFAQSLSGAWNWKAGRTSVEHAKTSALVGCQRNNRESEDLYPCKVININGEWVE